MTARFQELCARIGTSVKFLPDKPEETPESTVSALWHAAAGAPVSPEEALQRSLPELDIQAQRTLDAMIDHRMAGVPLAHLTGRQRFMGMEMLAGPQALVPRKETELLARTAIEVARLAAEGKGAITVIDVCTGCGNVALSMAQHVPAARVFAADLSDEAVALARQNASHLNLQDRVEFRAGDLLAPFETAQFLGRVDVLTCNPPYISSGKVGQMASEISAHEPSMAFDGGPFGVAILMRLLQDAPRFLLQGGWLVFEVGLGQGPAMATRLRKAGFGDIRTIADSAGAPRALAAQVR